MTRRNLRKWAEAKQQRLEQAAAHRNGARTLFGWLDEIQHFGMAVAPTVWLPMEPAVTDKQWYTYTFNYPPTEYDTNGYPLPPRIEPSITITPLPPDRDPAAAFTRALETLRTLQGLTPKEVAQAQSAFSQLAANYGAPSPDVGHVRHGQVGDWFRSIRWSAPAWQALHGAEGPRNGWEQ